jgi:2-methylisocitrate lyase-like PEP mutase family enzyme
MRKREVSIEDCKKKADILRSLHHGPRMLLLPNAWDVTSAKMVEQLGFPAIATTSAGIANSLGYPDGEMISCDEMLAIVGRIARAVLVPVSADMEAGYARTSDKMYETAAAIIQSGAVGLNLEDGEGGEKRLAEMDLQVKKIEAIKKASADLGVPLVINARTDAYWLKTAAESNRMAQTITRAQAYREAGADCIFVPGMHTADEIRELLSASPGPLNILAGPGSLPVKELEGLGVRRLSIGSGAFRAALGMMRRVATELRDGGTYAALTEYGVPFEEVKILLKS